MSQQHDIYQNFLKYDFGKDEKWISYIGSMYPTPKFDQIIHLKKKFYKKEINNEFDIDFDPSTSNNNQNIPAKKLSPIIIGIFHLEGNLKLLFFISCLLYTQITSMLTLIICVLAILRQLKKPKFSKEYGRKLMMNEFFHDLMYLVPFSIVPGPKFVIIYIPVMFHFAIGCAEYLNYSQGFIYKFGKKYIDGIRMNKTQLIYNKAKSEVFMTLFLIFGCIVGLYSFLILIFYGNYLRMKYMISNNLQYGFREVNASILRILAKPFVPGLFRFAYEKIRSLCSYLVKT